jgi:ribA/ribD-fused uncharacterized protein
MTKERNYIVHNDKEIKGFFDKYRFLSNFFPGEVIYEGVKYISSENAYQAAKTTDVNIRKQFANLDSYASKKLGRKISVREDWEDVKYQAMYDICYDKFTRNKQLGNLLKETGDRYIEETNDWGDVIWGVCNGVGKNWLGKILMDIRTEIQKI